MPIIHIKSLDQFNKIKDKGKLIIKFTAKWCGPCRAIAPEFERYASDPKCSSLTFVEVDIDTTPEIAKLYDVSSVPTFDVISKGSVIDSFSGASKADLKKMISQQM